ncbi:HAMP domain-containing sensor histidine kinase [Clostridium tarantellae]|uniref:histidine kinase n=1 Tax=Clostridium tarantellae TaxID=39493 RepID=A0A6I1MIY6_9CLOT|nr:HAMP domain-containing sensor histidine kinase [Clostridium tarantellae]MPQ43070.1 HAMP domain-containing protein [Clostridium tarantellae]
MLNKLKLNIKNKIILTNILILTPIILFISLLTINTLTENIISNSVKNILVKSESAQGYIEDVLKTNNPTDINYFLEESGLYLITSLSDKFNLRTQLYGVSGQLLYDSEKNELSLYNEDINKALEGKKAYLVKKIDGVPQILLSSSIFHNGKTYGVLRFIYKETNASLIIRKTILIMMILSLISIMIGVLLINTFAQGIVKPIIILKEKSKKIANGLFSQKVSICSGDEIEDLASTFNTMSSSLEDYIKQLKESKERQKNFFDNVSHEFKTPLTSIIGFSEIIPKLKEEEQIIESSQYIQREGIRLLALVEEVLNLSKLNKNVFNIESTFIDLKSLLDEVIKSFNIRLNNYHIEIVKKYSNTFVYGDYNKTKQVFINIIDNAIKYSGCELIIIEIIRKKDSIDVLIRDDGIGFDKNNKEIKGTGLGLNICKEIMNSQNGEFSIESILDQGCKVIVTFNIK